jgi:Protein of unknown function (DUF2798)
MDRGALLKRPKNLQTRYAMPRLPQRYAPLVFGIIQAAITTAVATAIATHQLTDFGILFLERWAFAWWLAWLTMLPIVIVFAPLIPRAVAAFTTPGAA